MKSLSRNRLVFALVAAAALELFGLAYFALRYQLLFYRHAPQTIGVERAAFAEALPAQFLFHPYFAFNRYPRSAYYRGPEGALKARNNDGFDSDEDYPYTAREPGEIVIGIFGGSVANALAVSDPDALHEMLAKLPVLAGHKITILPFCREGFKQPQQLTELAYYFARGQRFDIVINVDGYNEIAHGLHDIMLGVEDGMPMADLLRQVEQAHGLAGGSWMEEALRNGMSAALARLNRAIAWNRSAFVGALLDMARVRMAGTVHAIAEREAKRQSRGGWHEDEPVFLGTGQPSDDPARYWPRISSVWLRASLGMNLLATQEGALYLHILPPNQYYGARKFSEAESKVAFVPGGREAGSIVNAGYREFLRRSDELEAAGVRFVDATAAFDAIAAPLYADDCCHYNSAGNRVIYGVIADAIARYYKPPPP